MGSKANLLIEAWCVMDEKTRTEHRTLLNHDEKGFVIATHNLD